MQRPSFSGIRRLVATSFLLAPASSCTQPSNQESDGPQPKLDDQAACSLANLVNSKMVAAASFERQHGKPVVEHLHFSTAPDESLCITLVTGAPDSEGVATRAAPASLVSLLDEGLELAWPNDFNAKPQLITRAIAADALAAGDHDLTVELRGKPGGVASVAVFAVPAASHGATVNPISVARLADAGATETFVIDEAIVAFDASLTDTDILALIASLPFPALATGKLQNVPIYRLNFPGSTGGEEMIERVKVISGRAGVITADLHWIGGIEAESLPPTGDDDYISGADVRTFTSSGQHLADMNAATAWTWAPGGLDPVDMAILDSGFNVEHPELKNNIVACWGPEPATGDLTIHSQDCAQGSWENSDEEGIAHHGTAVAGLAGAEGGNKTVGDAANVLGVVWKPRLHLARYNDTAIVAGESQVLDDLQDVVAWRASAFSTFLYAEQFALAGIEVINMSFGKTLFKSDESPWVLEDSYLEADDPVEALQTRMDRQERLWSIVMERYDDVLFVVSAGNDGRKCEDGADPLFCTAAAKQGPCVVSDIVLSSRALCVSSFDGTDFSVYESSGRDGDLFAAPGRHLDILSFDGPLYTDKAGTSYAAPLAAGAAAFLFGLDEDLTPQDVHNALLYASQRKAVRPPGQVYRLLDLAASTRKIMCPAGVDSDIASDVCPRYYDVPEDFWAHGPITKLSCDCVLQGYPNGNGSFEPLKEISRVETLKIILELGFPDEKFDSSGDEVYADVPPGEWFSGYVEFAKARGMLDFLVSNEKFHPAKLISRGETVRLLVEAARHSCEDEFEKLHWAFLEFLDGAAPEVLYVDHETLGSAYEDAIYAATSRCIVSGYEDTDNFGASNPLLRAEVAKIGCLARHGLDSEKCGYEISCSPLKPGMFDSWKNDGC